jgi:hypothetical protein
MKVLELAGHDEREEHDDEQRNQRERNSGAELPRSHVPLAIFV